MFCGRHSDRGKESDTPTGGSPAEVRRGGIGEKEGGRKENRVLQLLSDREKQGSSSSTTMALVEALVSKNRRLSAYQQTIRELRDRVETLEEENRDRTKS